MLFRSALVLLKEVYRVIPRQGKSASPRQVHIEFSMLARNPVPDQEPTYITKDPHGPHFQSYSKSLRTFEVRAESDEKVYPFFEPVSEEDIALYLGHQNIYPLLKSYLAGMSKS